MKNIAWLVALVAASAISFGCASGRWVPADPVALPARDLSSDFLLRLVIDLRARGYTVEDHDVRHGFLRVRAKTNEALFEDRQRYTNNFFLIQLDQEGSVTLRPDGGLVRRGGTLMHKTLRTEFEVFSAIVSETLSKNRTSRRSPAQTL